MLERRKFKKSNLSSWCSFNSGVSTGYVVADVPKSLAVFVVFLSYKPESVLIIGLHNLFSDKPGNLFFSITNKQLQFFNSVW